MLLTSKWFDRNIVDCAFPLPKNGKTFWLWMVPNVAVWCNCDLRCLLPHKLFWGIYLHACNQHWVMLTTYDVKWCLYFLLQCSVVSVVCLWHKPNESLSITTAVMIAVLHNILLLSETSTACVLCQLGAIARYWSKIAKFTKSTGIWVLLFVMTGLQFHRWEN